MSIPAWLFDELCDHIADDRELVAVATAWADLLDGAEEILDSPVAECGCGRREREWRLTGPAVDVHFTYLSGRAYRDALAAGRDVVAKGPASGWIYETTPLAHGHLWVCCLCHPPAAGLDVESRDCRSGMP